MSGYLSQRHVHAAELGALLVKRRRAGAVFTTQVRHQRTGLGLLQHRPDLAVGKSRSLRCRTSSFHFEKTLPLKTVLLKGDYRQTSSHWCDRVPARHVLSSVIAYANCIRSVLKCIPVWTAHSSWADGGESILFRIASLRAIGMRDIVEFRPPVVVKIPNRQLANFPDTGGHE